MFKLKVKIFGEWGDFYESDTNRIPVIFRTIKEANEMKYKRVDMFGPIYKVVEVEK